MFKRYDLVAVVGEYEQNGEKKKRYAKLGSFFEGDKGDKWLNLDTIPAGNWDGKVSIREPFDGERPARQSSEPTRRNSGGNDRGGNSNRGSSGFDDIADSIPF